MYYYHLWIVLDEAPEDTGYGLFQEKIEGLKHLVSQKLICRPRNCIEEVNYRTVMQCSGGSNHGGGGQDHEDLLDVIDWIAENLPGSHGLVYWLDDEKPGRDAFDGYRVIVLARGHWRERFDPFLSPISPTVED